RVFSQARSHHPACCRSSLASGGCGAAKPGADCGGAAVPPGLGVTVPSVEPERAPSEGDDAAAEAVRQPVAMGALYAAEAPRLWRFFRRRTACPDEANDLVQETFTRVLAQEPRSGFRNAGGYLTRVAQNLLRDRAKFARRRSAD